MSDPHGPQVLNHCDPAQTLIAGCSQWDTPISHNHQYSARCLGTPLIRHPTNFQRLTT